MIQTVEMSLSDIGVYDEPFYVMRISQGAASWHSHNFYEVVFVTEGFCMHHLRDSVSLTMEGDILFIKPGVSHQYSGARECKIINCLFTEEAIKDVLEELLQLPGIFQLLVDPSKGFHQMHLDMRERKNLQKLLSQMEKECEQKEAGWQLKAKAFLYGILIDCSRIYAAHDRSQSKEDAYPGYVIHALRYIGEHYTEALTVRGLGEYVGISPDYLSRQFRAITGVAVQEYIRRYRLSRAVAYLQQGYSVGETAKKCGFGSIAYFSREFQKEMGMPPSLFEKQP